MTKATYNVAVIGATGNVGREMLATLVEREFPYKEVFAIASSDSRGKLVSFGLDKELTVKDINQFDFADIDIVLCSAGSEVAKFYATQITKGGAILIDNSSAFRRDDDVPLIVPEVNQEALENIGKRSIIANPNCVAIPAAMALKALAGLGDITHINISSYQSVSGAGKAAMDELYAQTKQKFLFQDPAPTVFPRPIAFNIIPQVGDIHADGYTGEEDKIISEIQKLLDIKCSVAVTAVRVPVFVGHSLSLEVTLSNAVSVSAAKAALSEFPGIVLLDEESEFSYATPAEIVGEDPVFVSRIRAVRGDAHKLLLWIVSDNLRKGAALNAVQIAESLVEGGYL